ncbi:MAG TPA: ATP-binding protein [Acidimicrobiales bacterium]|nr:ATP-binding protein [Acidimicrobiales bacterium]
MRLAKAGIVILAGIFLLYLAGALTRILWDWPSRPDLYARCEGRGNECGALIGTTSSLLTLATATAIFVVWRLGWARRPVWRKARSAAREYVPTAANSIMDEVVGRDELCQALNDELRLRRSRRPHLLVGGIGSGKTAVMVRLTELLAESRAVPVPIRLRDIGDTEELDFGETARKEFIKLVDSERLTRGLTAKAIGDQAWRWLRKEDRIVVLADGLEEVFAGKNKEQDRDNLIRRAIRKAGDEELPLVIASRPHAPLRDVEAAITELEPLSEEAALGYIEGGTWSEDEPRLDWIVERAEVSEAPLYLQVANQLYHADRLTYVVERRDEDKLDTRETDRAGLRYRLLSTWVASLCDGYLREELALTKQERREAVAWISALACLGLRHDTIEVRFETLLDEEDDCAQRLLPLVRDRLESIADLEGEGSSPLTLRRRGGPDDDSLRRGDYIRALQLAATWGEQLQLVEAHGGHVRFQHSLLQAYLGSRCLGTAIESDGPRFLDEALGLDGADTPGRPRPAGRPAHDGDDGKARRADTGPSRELLTSLVFMSRSDAPGDQHEHGERPSDSTLQEVVKSLLDAAAHRPNEKALDLFAAALEIDRARDWTGHREIVDRLWQLWPTFTSQDRRGLLDAKLNLVHRLGDGLRGMTRDRQVRLTRLTATNVTTTSVTATDVITTSVTAASLGDAGVATTHQTLPDVEESYRAFFDIGCGDPEYGVRLAAAEEIGMGGREAYAALEAVWNSRTSEHAPGSAREHPPAPPPEFHKKDWGERWLILSAWLAPMLLGSVQDEDTRLDAKHMLSAYVNAVGRSEPAGRRSGGSPLVLEIALAQGFKAAANRRVRHPATCPQGKALLVEQAEELLKSASFWYAHLTLVHALTLWSLPDRLPSAVVDGSEATASWRNTSPKMQVDRWLSLADREATTPARVPSRSSRRRARQERARLHPFLREAGELAVLALASGRPETYLWIDETGVIDKVGSRPSDPTQSRVHRLWIPPSTGWTALDRRAQQLVADVRLLLDLSHRGDEPEDHARYLERANRRDLPFCLTGDRRPMQPDLSVAKPGTSDPGSSCADGCPFELCPYPPRGTVQRNDLGETFCRRQLTMLSDRRRHRAAFWQLPTRRDVIRQERIGWRSRRVENLRWFWKEMANRRTVPRPGAKSR